MKTKFVKLSKHSFVRIYDDGKLGYVINQKTELDRVYDNIGADFLSQLKREPRSFDDIADELLSLYKNTDRQLIYDDLQTFIYELLNYKFVVVADSIEELNAFDEDRINDASISKLQKTEKVRDEDTTQYFWFKHDANNPCLRTLHIELTSKCNERCIHCYIPNSIKDVGVNMSIESFKSLIDQFYEMGGVSVTLSGGEPLLNKNIADILYYCREKDMRISLFTNLLAIDDALIKVMKDVNISNVQVSLYSTDSICHDEITRVKGSYRKTISAIEKLKKYQIPVSISCPLMKANKDTMGELIKYAQSRGIPVKMDYVIMAQSNFDKENLENRLTIEETENALRDIIENDTERIQLADKNALFNRNVEYEDFPLCSAATHTLCVSANGNISPCVSLSGIVAGNLNNKSLKEIWDNSEKLKRIRLVRQKHFPKCLVCEAKKYCKMCMGQNYNESGGDIFKINPHFCDVAFLTKRIIEEHNCEKQTN
jgi:radical SAM protein with 4Fe4S-binding SPASM domain